VTRGGFAELSGSRRAGTAGWASRPRVLRRRRCAPPLGGVASNWLYRRNVRLLAEAGRDLREDAFTASVRTSAAS
jgi:hypothetical protein